jgi:2-keto-3-deoxy-L-rhamnonate aldolase RhmA
VVKKECAMNKQSGSGGAWKSPFFTKSPGARTVARSLQLGKELRRKARAGRALGTFVIDLPHASTITALSVAGFDFLVLDMEHSSLDFGCLAGLIDASRAAGIPALVRPFGRDEGVIGKILDMGAHGVMVPHVDCPERAGEIVSQARFAPRGQRGFSPVTRFDSLEEPLRELDEAAYVVVQIEGRSALERVADISAVDGIDAIFVGPYDLALSLGVEPGSEQVYEAALDIATRVPEYLALGIYLDDPATSGQWAERGFALQCVSFDGRMLAGGAGAVVGQAGEWS